jgi:phosphate acetyltransferase
MQILYLVPTRDGVGLTSASLGLVRALQHQGFRVGFAKPIAQDDALNDRSILFGRSLCHVAVPDALSIDAASDRLAEGQESLLLDEIVATCLDAAKDVDVLIVEGMHTESVHPFTPRLNAEVIRSLKAEAVLVSAVGEGDAVEEVAQMAKRYAAVGCHAAGAIINRVPRFFDASSAAARIAPVALWGVVPYDRKLAAPRTLDVARHLDARTIVRGDIAARRVLETVTAARSVPEIIPRLVAGALIVTAGDREDVILATALAASKGIQLAGLILTHGSDMDPRVRDFTAQAFEGGLPILGVDTDSYRTATMIHEVSPAVAADDKARMSEVLDAVAEALPGKKLSEFVRIPASTQMSPPAFRYKLMEKARAANKRIVLPEGDEPRTIRAAVICTQRRIARCALLGKRQAIEAVAAAHGIALAPEVEIIDPDSVRERYVGPMTAMRKSKNLTPDQAREHLSDNVYLGTMMLALDDVDGLVSGAVHTTANTVRPALQLIKTEPGSTIVSSVFFMLLPDQVLVYGDCAVNPDPTAKELAEIALQSAGSAAAFGIEPRVAMISYSTGNSGAGVDVEKVREATAIAKGRAPEMPIDGPLQYDAASVLEVGLQKAPNSKVAGRATVFVFPDLNTGNTTYKAVQRSAHVLSVGPMLQGLRKPVNDLSRGALVDDIVFTIALTAIQADSLKQLKAKALVAPAQEEAAAAH